MTVVVHSRRRVFGPFADGNEALAWSERARNTLAADELPLIITVLDNPELVVGAGWRAPRQPTDFKGRTMNYKPGSGKSDWQA